RRSFSGAFQSIASIPAISQLALSTGCRSALVTSDFKDTGPPEGFLVYVPVQPRPASAGQSVESGSACNERGSSAQFICDHQLERCARGSGPGAPNTPGQTLSHLLETIVRVRAPIRPQRA